MTEAQKKYMNVLELLPQVYDPMVAQFFDTDSEELLDEKIEVLQDLIDGKHPEDIPNYEKILELKPKDKQHWDL